MKTIKCEFTVGTRYVGSTVTDEVEIDVEIDATPEEIESEIEEAWVQWRNEQCDGGWKVLSEKIEEED